jgi:hypothetical protein
MKSWRFDTSNFAAGLRDQTLIWVAAAWWASLTMLGFVVVPLLFIYLPTPAMAGTMAGHLFTAQTWISTACALGLLALYKTQGVPTTPWRLACVVLGLVCAAAAEWIVVPHIVARDNLALWHRLGSGMYLVQWLCAIAVFRGLLRRSPQALATANDQV